MKRLICLLAVLIMAAPTFADVTIKCTDGVVSYTSTEAERIRAFALDVTVDQDKQITSITDYKDDGYSTSTSKGYGIYMTAIDLTNPVVPVWGDPVADPAENPYSVGKIPGATITVELGSLYDGSENAPVLTEGDLFTIGVDGCCNVSFALNTEIGGIILEGDPPTSAALIDGGGTAGCGGIPECWQNAQFCRGDAGQYVGEPPVWSPVGDGTVNTDDWPPFRDAFQKTYPDASYDPCGDFDMNGVVDTDDWPAFRDNFQQVPTDDDPIYLSPDPDPRDPITGPCSQVLGTWPPS